MSIREFIFQKSSVLRKMMWESKKGGQEINSCSLNSPFWLIPLKDIQSLEVHDKTHSDPVCMYVCM